MQISLCNKLLQLKFLQTEYSRCSSPHVGIASQFIYVVYPVDQSFNFKLKLLSWNDIILNDAAIPP